MFEIINRGYDRSMALVSGWGFDNKIFSRLELPFNYILYNSAQTNGFASELKLFLAKCGIKRISLLGWSLGAFAAADFAADNKNIIDDVILLAVQKKYPLDDIENVKSLVDKNAKAFMATFYKNCFCSYEKEDYNWFKKTLEKGYLEKINKNMLLAGLDHLGEVKLKTIKLRDMKRLFFVHGQEDKIASVNDVLELAGELTNAKIIILERVGHLPFLQNDFDKILYG